MRVDPRSMAVFAAGCAFVMLMAANNFMLPAMPPHRMQQFSGETNVKLTMDHATSNSSSACRAAAVVAMIGVVACMRKMPNMSISSTKQQSRAACVSQAAFDPTTQLGVTNPLGYWDPVGLMTDRTGAWKDEATFRWYRMAELKHGRLAMMATIGITVETFFKFPGVFREVPEECSGWRVLTAEGGPGAAGFGIIILAASFFELNWWKQDPSKEPGDFGDPLGIGKWGGFGYTVEMRNKEINHGRLAMSGVAAEFLIEYGTGKTPYEQLQESNVPGSVIAVVIALLLVAWQGDNETSVVTEAAPIGEPIMSPSAPATKIEEPAKVYAKGKPEYELTTGPFFY